MTLVMTSSRWGDGLVSTSNLVARAKSGDKAAFEALVVQNERRVLMTALRLLGHLEDAQDASQEVFLRLYKYLARFDETRSLAPWLYRMTVNVCHDVAKTRARSGFVPLENNLLEHMPGPAGAEPMEEQADQRRIVSGGLRTLTAKERAALVLRDIEGLSTSEVAKILGSRETTVRSHLSRARVKMKRYRDRFLRRK
jgi:RNA polymerase sigma-70 factor (ECF subfamily)